MQMLWSVHRNLHWRKRVSFDDLGVLVRHQHRSFFGDVT
jgi:hypothetical protein